MRVSIILIGLGLVVGLPPNVQALDASVRCREGKVKEAARYYACRFKAKIKTIRGSITPDFSKCDSKYTQKWERLEDKRCAGEPPSFVTEESIQDQVTADSDAIVASLSGVRFADNGDGTITDNQTGLMWEQKTNDPNDIHYKDDQYTWTATDIDPNADIAPNGTLFTVFLGTLNNGSAESVFGPISGCFAGHCDWRLPSIVELRTILFTTSSCDPCIDPIFGPTASPYWSATADPFVRGDAWTLRFIGGCSFDFCVTFIDRDGNAHVRAVRGEPYDEYPF